MLKFSAKWTTHRSMVKLERSLLATANSCFRLECTQAHCLSDVVSGENVCGAATKDNVATASFFTRYKVAS